MTGGCGRNACTVLFTIPIQLKPTNLKVIVRCLQIERCRGVSVNSFLPDYGSIVSVGSYTLGYTHPESVNHAVKTVRIWRSRYL